MTTLEKIDDDLTTDLWDTIDEVKECARNRLKKGSLTSPALIPVDHFKKLKDVDLEFVLQRLRGFRLEDICLRWVPYRWCFELVTVD